MPSDTTHVQIAERFEAVADHLERHRYYDWELVARFYAALHYVEAHFGRDRRHLNTHGQRDRALGDPKHPLWPVYSHYCCLRDQSEDVRYRGKEFDDPRLTPLRASYAEVRSRCRALLGLS